MAAKDKVQCPIRLYPETWKKVKAKTADDGISFQKLMEAVVRSYLKGNKEISRIVNRHKSETAEKRRRYGLTDAERNEILRKIEQEVSPIRELDELVEKIKNE